MYRVVLKGAKIPAGDLKYVVARGKTELMPADHIIAELNALQAATIEE